MLFERFETVVDPLFASGVRFGYADRDRREVPLHAVFREHIKIHRDRFRFPRRFRLGKETTLQQCVNILLKYLLLSTCYSISNYGLITRCKDGKK